MDAKAYFMVRAEVSNPADRPAFDRWYAVEHMPLAIEKFAAKRGWRCWSRLDPKVHVAFYEFDSVERAEAILRGEAIRDLIADFDRDWGDRVTRSREILERVEVLPA
jgi:hypothetical protein